MRSSSPASSDRPAAVDVLEPAPAAAAGEAAAPGSTRCSVPTGGGLPAAGHGQTRGALGSLVAGYDGHDASRRTREYDYADEGQLLHALDAALAALDAAEVPFLVVGGVASAVHGRPRWTRDIDLFFRLEDATRALDALEGAGFETTIVDPHWLAKAPMGDIVVDVLTRSKPDVLLDDEMLERSVWADFKGRSIRLLPPEDLLVMKAVAASEDTPRYWYDAIGIAARSDLDWDYLLARARRAARGACSRCCSTRCPTTSRYRVEPLRELADLVLGRREDVAAGARR